jgi:hypothetical protein
MEVKKVSAHRFRDEVRESCVSALVSVGFSRFRKDSADLEILEGFRCWVGLNLSAHAEYVDVNPFVGLHATHIEKLWTRLKLGKYAAKYDRGVATYGLHFGEIRPGEKAFRFSLGSSIEPEARRLAILYVDYGIPYARSIAKYETLLPLLEKRIGMLGGFPERYASCLHLMGNTQRAREFVTEFEKTHQAYFEGFAGPFLAETQH